MLRFSVPPKLTTVVFMPFDSSGKRLTESGLRKNYPDTWKHLSSAKGLLSDRSSVRKGSINWWEPERARSPDKMFVPKLVTPHLVLLPRFGIDLDGKYAISARPTSCPIPIPAEIHFLRSFVL